MPRHYSAAPRGSTVEERFWLKVDTNGPVPAHAPELGPCYVWTGSTNEHGYGTFWQGPRRWKAHRFAWLLAEGREPSEHALHRCDNPPCVRRSHLFEGSQSDNMLDMYAKGRKVPIVLRAAQNGHASLRAEQVATIRSTEGETISALARRFKVSRTHIRRLRRGEGWSV